MNVWSFTLKSLLYINFINSKLKNSTSMLRGTDTNTNTNITIPITVTVTITISVTISNGNRTEWSPIRSVIIRVITKSDDRAAGV